MASNGSDKITANQLVEVNLGVFFVRTYTAWQNICFVCIYTYMFTCVVCIIVYINVLALYDT